MKSIEGRLADLEIAVGRVEPRLTRTINETDKELVRQRDTTAATLFDYEQRITRLEDIELHRTEAWEEESRARRERDDQLYRLICSERERTDEVFCKHEGRLNDLEAPEFDPRDDLRPTVVGDCVIGTKLESGMWVTTIEREGHRIGTKFKLHPDEWHESIVNLVRLLQEK